MKKTLVNTKAVAVKPDKAEPKKWLTETDLMAALVDEYDEAEEKRRVKVKPIAPAAPKVRRK